MIQAERTEMECGVDINIDPDSTKVALALDNNVYVGEDVTDLIKQVSENTCKSMDEVASMIQRMYSSFETLGESTSTLEKSMLEFKRLITEGDVYIPDTRSDTNHFFDPRSSKKRRLW